MGRWAVVVPPCHAADRVHWQAHTPGFNARGGGLHLVCTSRQLLSRLPPRGCRKAEGCWKGVSGWETPVEAAISQLLPTVRFGGKLREDEDGNGVMSGWGSIGS